jgi:hypothetical protein
MLKTWFNFSAKQGKINEISKNLLSDLIQRLNAGEEISFNEGSVIIKREDGVFKTTKIAVVEEVLDMLELYTIQKAYDTRAYHEYLIEQKMNTKSKEVKTVDTNFNILYNEQN